jgi:LruC domain-containing protein
MDITFKVISTGATFDNSFAIRLPFDPSLISGISGQHFSKNVFNTNSIGFEPDGDGIVLPIFDSTLNLFGKFINVFPDESFYSPVLLTVSLDLEPGIDAITSLKPPYDRLPIF